MTGIFSFVELFDDLRVKRYICPLKGQSQSACGVVATVIIYIAGYNFHPQGDCNQVPGTSVVVASLDFCQVLWESSQGHLAQPEGNRSC